MVPTGLTLPCGVTRSSRALSRSVTRALPSGRNAIAHGTARFRASTDGCPMCWPGGTASPGACAWVPGDGAAGLGAGPAPVAQAAHTRPALTAITARERDRICLPPVRARVAPDLAATLLAGGDGGTLPRACSSIAIGDAVNMEE